MAGKGGQITIEKDPCFMESKASMKCLNDFNFDRSQCQEYFANYKACKKFWSDVTLGRKRKGISPHLPPHEERQAIKERYIQTGKIPTSPDG